MLRKKSSIVFVLVMSLAHSAAAQSDATLVRRARAAQNRAIAAHDTAAIASYWTDDVDIRRGLGVLATGRESYKALFNTTPSADEVVFQRIPKTVLVSSTWPLAYEEGEWIGHVGSATGPMQIRGRYAAQWVKRAGKWLIRSETYVALDCAAKGCAAKAAP